jgi:hypothetical protein
MRPHTCALRSGRSSPHSDGCHFDGRPSPSGHCGRGWTCSLPGPVAINTRKSQDGTVKKSLHRPRLSAIILGSRPPALIQIAAPFSSRLSRYNSPTYLLPLGHVY